MDSPTEIIQKSYMNVPTEITRKIFLELCPPQKRTKFPLKPNQIRVSLTHVSSRWRAVALATPELWTNIFIQIDSHRQLNLPRLLDLVNIWSSRSGQSMLSFDAGADDYSSLSPIFDLIRPHIHRCSFLRLFGLGDATIRRLLSLSPSSLFSLQKIIIVGRDSQPDATSPPSEGLPITAFQPCPQLRNATLLFYGHDINVAHFNLPWHQLTNLDLSTFSASPDALLSVLSKCASLEYCDIRVSDISPLVLQGILSLSDDPVVLPLLQRLSLCFPSLLDIHDNGNGDSHFLAAIRCPILRELTLASSSSVSLSLSSLQLFYRPCSETLEFLDSGSVYYDYLPETLHLLPHLTTLYADTSSLFPHSAQQLGEGTIAPRLTTLGISGIEIGECLDIVEARVKAARADPRIASFTEISLSHSYGDRPGYVARVAALREIGVDIEIYDL